MIPRNGFYAVLLGLVLLATPSFAQLEVTYTRAKALVGVTSPRIINDRILVGEDSNVSTSQVGLLRVKTDYQWTRVEAFRIDWKNQRVEYVDVVPIKDEAPDDGINEFLLVGSGSYSVTVYVSDPAKPLDIKRLEVNLDNPPGPTPPGPTPPEPGPTPPEPGPDIPTGPFDNLAQRVYKVTRPLTVDERAKWTLLLGDALDKMTTYKFQRVTDVVSYIRSKAPPCSDPAACAAFNRLVYEDASGRTLSWRETIQFYEEIVKGLKR